jgi:hypothetical protein
MSVDILQQVNKYYSQKIQQYGLTPQGVDWNGEESQFRRFYELMRVVSDEPQESEFSLLDYGCGYGGMIDFLLPIYAKRINYYGFDVSEAMIHGAKVRYGSSVRFTTSLGQDDKFDYVVASGIFNVKQNRSDHEWADYVFSILNDMHDRSVKGFSFNILTSYSDKEYMKDYLFYAQPEELFAYCKKHYSKKVAILHDYPLYEFTVIVKK